MFNKFQQIKLSDKTKIVLSVGGYVLLSEVIKKGAVIYVLEQSLELKLILFWWTVILVYKIPELLMYFSMVFFLFLSLYGLPTGFIIYMIIFYAFVKLLNQARKSTNE